MKKNVNIKRLVKPSVRGLKAYEAKEIPARVKLDANESPFGFGARLPAIATNRYPDPEAKDLRKILGRGMGVPASSILTGNGSDELIYYLITTFGGPVMFPTPTFVMYSIIAQALGEESVAVPLDERFDLDEKSVLNVIRKEKPKLIFLSSPNNPTGNCFSTDRILKIIEASRGIVIVDEAYQPFAGDRGFVPMLADYKNLVIMRTLSKVGLAALRVGYIAAHEDIIGEVNKVRLPFNLNACSQALAVSALKDRKGMRQYIGTITRERKKLMIELEKMNCVSPYPSESNFILFRVDNPLVVYNSLLKRGVLVRNMDAVIKGCIRVTVGTEKENRIFIKALKETLKACERPSSNARPKKRT
jgi:histidinol-phosphate aminotransferase